MIQRGQSLRKEGNSYTHEYHTLTTGTVEAAFAFKIQTLRFMSLMGLFASAIALLCSTIAELVFGVHPAQVFAIVLMAGVISAYVLRENYFWGMIIAISAFFGALIALAPTSIMYSLALVFVTTSIWVITGFWMAMTTQGREFRASVEEIFGIEIDGGGIGNRDDGPRFVTVRGQLKDEFVETKEKYERALFGFEVDATGRGQWGESYFKSRKDYDAFVDMLVAANIMQKKNPRQSNSTVEYRPGWNGKKAAWALNWDTMGYPYSPSKQSRVDADWKWAEWEQEHAKPDNWNDLKGDK